jgi:DNA-binding transcriptional ArsR family regulator
MLINLSLVTEEALYTAAAGFHDHKCYMYAHDIAFNGAKGGQMKRLHLRILEYLVKKDGLVTPAEIAYHVGLTFRQVNAHLRTLKVKGYIEQVEGKWVLVEGLPKAKEEAPLVYVEEE